MFWKVLQDFDVFGFLFGPCKNAVVVYPMCVLNGWRFLVCGGTDGACARFDAMDGVSPICDGDELSAFHLLNGPANGFGG